MASNNSGSNSGGNRRRVLVPGAKQALEQMKFEAAQQLGVQIPADGYYGNVATRDAGSLGGYITKNLVQIAEQQLSGLSGQGQQNR